MYKGLIDKDVVKEFIELNKIKIPERLETIRRYEDPIEGNYKIKERIMLLGKTTKYNAGIKIYGDYFDLESLYETVHYLCDENDSILVYRVSEYVLSFAYEIRHAMQKDRFKDSFGDFDDIKVDYYGFQILWPQFILFLSLLRYAAGFKTTNSEHQANLYRLQHICNSVLKKLDAGVAEKIISLQSHLSDINSEDFLTQFINEASLRYISYSNGAKKRFKNLPKILKSIDTWSKEYKTFDKELRSIAEKNNCSPHKLVSSDEWPSFRW